MKKTINISEKKFMQALKRIVEMEDVFNNYEPFKRQGTPYDSVEDGHGESIVGKNVDPTVYDKNAPDGIVNA